MWARRHRSANRLPPRNQNGKSSSSGGGASSSGGPSQAGGASRDGGAERRAIGGGYGLGEPSRAGQMTPSHPGPPRSRGLFRHLKSGARGLRLEARSSHIGPPQTGQRGIPFSSSAGFAAAWLAPRATGARVAPAGVATAGSRPPVGLLGVAFAVADAARGGQITPPQVVSLHLKSGAFGFRFPSRLSHIGPSHLGQLGTGDAASGVWGWLIGLRLGDSQK